MRRKALTKRGPANFKRKCKFSINTWRLFAVRWSWSWGFLGGTGHPQLLLPRRTLNYQAWASRAVNDCRWAGLSLVCSVLRRNSFRSQARLSSTHPVGGPVGSPLGISPPLVFVGLFSFIFPTPRGRLPA